MKYNSNDILTVWVDLDDTLIDFTTNAHTALTRMWQTEPQLQQLFPSPDAWADAYEAVNMALWAQYNLGQIERSYLRMERFRRPLAEAGMSDEEARATSSRFDPIYLDFLAQGKAMMPGAMELMDWLRAQGVKIGCLSNGFKDVQYRKIANVGLDRYFDMVVLSDDIGVNKPDRRLYDYAREQAGSEHPEQNLMIGDNPDTDIAGAIGAGWGAVWYCPDRNPYADRRGKCCHAALLVDDLHKLPELLQQHRN